MATEREEAAWPGKPCRESGNDRAGHWRQATMLSVASLGLFGFFGYAGYSVGPSGAVSSRPAPLLGAIVSPAPAILSKASLVSDAALAPLPQTQSQAPVILASLKADFQGPETVGVNRGDRLVTSLIVTPPIGKLENGWRALREGRRRIVAERKKRIAEHSCLARAIYFEARSESELGQLAVAKVILNRVKNPLYPDTICDVVYQDSDQANACQFSFACDGFSDNPRPGKAWNRAKKIAARALAGENKVEAVSTAMYYHADYVRPKWSDTMTKLIQIGRHIFYTDG